ARPGDPPPEKAPTHPAAAAGNREEIVGKQCIYSSFGLFACLPALARSPPRQATLLCGPGLLRCGKSSLRSDNCRTPAGIATLVPWSICHRRRLASRIFFACVRWF